MCVPNIWEGSECPVDTNSLYATVWDRLNLGGLGQQGHRVVLENQDLTLLGKCSTTEFNPLNEQKELSAPFMPM